MSHLVTAEEMQSLVDRITALERIERTAWWLRERWDAETDRAIAAEARAQKAETENRDWEVLVKASHNERERLLKAEAVVEAARDIRAVVMREDLPYVAQMIPDDAVIRLSQALALYDEPPTPKGNDLWAAWNRCPVCEGLDQPGLIHNPQAPYCSQREVDPAPNPNGEGE